MLTATVPCPPIGGVAVAGSAPRRLLCPPRADGAVHAPLRQRGPRTAEAREAAARPCPRRGRPWPLLCFLPCFPVPAAASAVCPCPGSRHPLVTSSATPGAGVGQPVGFQPGRHRQARRRARPSSVTASRDHRAGGVCVVCAGCAVCAVCGCVRCVRCVCVRACARSVAATSLWGARVGAAPRGRRTVAVGHAGPHEVWPRTRWGGRPR